MSVDRVARLDSLLKRVVADAIFRVFQADDVDPGRLTVTSVSCAKDLRNATVRVSVFGPEADRPRALHHLVKHAREFQAIINREVGLKFTPVLRFVLDESLAKGDHVLTVLDHMAHGEAAADDASAAPLPRPVRRNVGPVFTPVK